MTIFGLHIEYNTTCSFRSASPSKEIRRYEYVSLPRLLRRSKVNIK